MVRDVRKKGKSEWDIQLAAEDYQDLLSGLEASVSAIVIDNSLPDLLAELVGREKFVSPRIMAAACWTDFGTMGQ